MSKADVSTTLIRSRRAVLAGIAAGGVVAAASPAVPAAGATTDPIFAVIDAFRRTDAEFMTFEGDDIPDELGDRQWDAYYAVLRTRPITTAGLVALTAVVRERADRLCPHSSMSGEELCAITAAINDAARGMCGLEPWSPPLIMSNSATGGAA